MQETSHSDYEVLFSPIKKAWTEKAPKFIKNLGKVDRGGTNITTADEIIMIGTRTKRLYSNIILEMIIMDKSNWWISRILY